MGGTIEGFGESRTPDCCKWLEQGLGTYLGLSFFKPCISLSGVEFWAGINLY